MLILTQLCFRVNFEPTRMIIVLYIAAARSFSAANILVVRGS